MTDDEHGRHAGHVKVTQLSVLIGKSGKRNPGQLTVQGPGTGAAAQSAPELRIGISDVQVPVRVVALFQESAAVDRNELGELRMHRRTMQAFVVVLPEYFPIATNVFQQYMANHQFLERPCIEPIQGQIEYLVEGRRLVGEGHEYEAAPLAHMDFI